MPEKGWTTLTVRERVGIRIKELAKEQGLTVSNYLERVIVVFTTPSGIPTRTTVDAIVATAEANEIKPKSVGPKNLATIIIPK